MMICPGDGGEITAGSEIEMKIGQNALNSGIGINQIINPILEGTFFISIAGTFGDSGSVFIPISENSGININTSVEDEGGGSSWPSPSGSGCSDKIAPVISGINITNLTKTSVDIFWITDENASGLIEYGLTESYELEQKTDTSLVLARTMILNDLSEAIEYHFRVSSSDLCGNKTTSADYSFTTTDETLPIISDLEVVDVTTTSARITWTTNEAADSLVNFGTTMAYGLDESDDILTVDHSVILLGLSEDTTYHFIVTSTDSSDNSVSSSDQTFVTLNNPAPSNVSSFAVTAGDEENFLSWELPDDDDLTGVLIVVCLDGFPSSYNDTDCTEIYDDVGTSFNHRGLTNGVMYYYGAFAYDTADQYASGALAAATPSSVLPPGDVCGDGVCGETEDSLSCLVDCPTSEPAPSGGDVCGDKICGGTETPETCSVDCSSGGSGDVCGNTVCELSETIFSCPADCSIPTEPENPNGCTDDTCFYCGDAVCQDDETSETCPSDCPTIEIPPTTVGNNEKIPSSDVSFITKKGSFKLEPSVGGIVEILVDSEIYVVVSSEHLTKEVGQIIFTIGSENYLLTKGDTAYSADVTVADTPARYALSIIINYLDGTNQTLSFIGNLLSLGSITTNGELVNGAKISLYSRSEDGWVVWDGSLSGQNNPVVGGHFGWYVANGTYQIVVVKDGYQEKTLESIQTTNHIINQQITIDEKPKITSITIVQTIQGFLEQVRNFRENPEVQSMVSTAIPIVVATTVASTVILTTSFNLLSLLRFLLTSPILLIGRRKRKSFGVVYHALTKRPIDLALIRLYRTDNNKLVGSRVTDKNGRYFFLVPPGQYRLEVIKKGFIFPSPTLISTKDDAIYLDVYHGEKIVVSENRALLTPNIPLDPEEQKEVAPKKIKRQQNLRRLQKTLAWTGLLVSAAILFIVPSVINAIIFGSQIVIQLLFKRLATAPKPKSWAIVYNHATNRPLADVIIRIFETKYHKLLETTLTDNHGRYTFFLGPNQYSSTFEKPGFQTAEIAPIEYSKNQDIQEWAQDIKLVPKQEEKNK